MTAREARVKTENVRFNKVMKGIEAMTEWCNEVLTVSIPCAVERGDYNCRRNIPEKFINNAFTTELAQQFVENFFKNWDYEVEFEGTYAFRVKWQDFQILPFWPGRAC